MQIAEKNPTVYTADLTSPVRELWPKFVLPFLDRSQPINWLEIGSFEGRSALWTVENMFKHPESRITCVDPWLPWNNYAGHDVFDFEKNFDANTFGIPQIVKLKGFSKDILPTLPRGSFHGCYIDGPHEKEHVLEDAELALPLLRSKALVVFDDYGWVDGPGVKAAVDVLAVEWGSKAIVRCWDYQVIFQLL
jgi:predicted O-methyltransferase YrrM